MGKRLKIAMVIDTYFPMIDGVVMVVDNYAKRLQKYADVKFTCTYMHTQIQGKACVYI